MSALRHLARTAAAALAVLSLAGCAGAPYVWIDNLAPARAAAEYVIEPGDLVSVRVFGQDNMSVRARVRIDGKLAVPFLGDVEVAGKTPAAVSKDLAARFKEYVNSPNVTTTVEEQQATSVSVLGEVQKPGIYTLDTSSVGVLSALAAAGGLTDYASKDSIYVVRRAAPSRVRFSFSSLGSGEGRAAAFRLHAGDIVIVE